MKNNASLIYAFFLVIGDFLALVAAFAAAYFLRFRLLDTMDVSGTTGRAYLLAVVSTLPVWIIVHALIGLYNQAVYLRRFAELGRLLVGSFVGILGVIGYEFFAQSRLFPGRLVPLYALILGFGFLVIFRNIARVLRGTLYRYGYGVSNVVIIGDTEATTSFVKSLSDTSTTGQRVLATIGREVAPYRSYESLETAIRALRRPIHSVIQTELYRDQDQNNAIVRYCQTNHISYRFVPGNTDLFVGNIAVELFAGLPVVAVHQTALIGWGKIVKRLFDLLFTSILLIITAPLFIMCAVLIKLSDPRSKILFRQTRLTRFNREFQVYKFRTVKKKYNRLTPEEAFAKMGKPELIKQYREGGDQLPNDPRFGRIGQLIRRASLDELPQLWNVIKGDISLVGPRALIPQELNAFDRKHAVLSVKSGVTGLAQVSGRRDISFDQRRTLDIYYVQNWSFWLDISILLKTLRVVITGIGAK